MTNNFLLKTSKFFLYLIPFTLVIVYQGSLFPFIVGKYVFFRTTVELALIFFIWGWAKGELERWGMPQQKTKQKIVMAPATSGPKRLPLWEQPIVLAVTGFVLVFLIAGFLGYNPQASFWSNFERGEGGLQIIHLFILFILLTLLFVDKESWRRLFLVSIWAASFVILYGVLGALHVDNFIGSNLCQRFSGSLGNPAYLGTYMIFAIFYAIYLSIYENKISKKWIFWSLAFVFLVFLLLSQTRGALLGLGTAILAGLIYFFFSLKNNRARTILLTLIFAFIILGSLGIAFRRDINLTPFCGAEVGGGNRILDVSFEGETYQTRLLLWKQAIKAFEERPILGWGAENFAPAFEKYFDTRHTAWFDRAHSLFFDYLVFGGILGLLSFLGIFATFFWQFFKLARGYLSAKFEEKTNKFRGLAPAYGALMGNALVLTIPIAYLAQGLVLFDVLPIYINIFLFWAFVNFLFTKWELGHYE